MIKYGLNGRVICVTGGSSGIGRSTVLAAARDGAHVAVVARRMEAIESTVAEAKAFGVRAAGFPAEVRDAVAFRKAVDDIEKTLGPIEGLVVSTGRGGQEPIEALPDEEWNEVLSINVTGTFITCREVGARMIRRGKGSIVIVGSVDSLGGHPGRGHYVTSKFAVVGLTKNLAIEWGRHGVRVNCIAPHMVETPLLLRSGVPASFRKNVVEDRTPMGRIGRLEEVASVSLMLLSDATSFVTGAVLPVDGGFTAGYFTHQQGADLSSNRLLQAGIYSEDAG
ncbi:MAG: SDR family NAD(P)-dependent oxidoreductase [bacterium]